ncbi:MAG: hypothetical protein B7733_12530 [Myxococcales bacterium FL481]|nr:MAG: hypothetical protein B7733_12530 [Myxococcales bacterium FL481]
MSPFHEPEVVAAVVGQAERSLLDAAAELERLERSPAALERLDPVYLCFEALAGNAAACGLTEVGEFADVIARNVADLLTAALPVSPTQSTLLRQAVELALALVDGSQVGPAPARTRAAFLARFARECALMGQSPPTGPAADLPGRLGAAGPDRAANDGATGMALGVTGAQADAASRLDAMTGAVRDLLLRVREAVAPARESRALSEHELHQIEGILRSLVSELDSLRLDVQRHPRDVGGV